MITKHPGTGGLVTVGTVTAQLLYEIAGPAYPNPDVVARFDTIRLDEDGPDRVRISGTRGEPAPATTKVCINFDGGFRNRMTFVLTGLDQEAKAAWIESRPAPGGRRRRRRSSTRFVAGRRRTGPTRSGRAACSTSSPGPADERAVGRAFSGAAVELALASIPASSRPAAPAGAQAFGVYWPALVPADEVAPRRRARPTAAGCASTPSPTGPPPDPPIEPPPAPAVEPLGRADGRAARRPLRRPLRRQGRQRQRRRVGPRRRRLRLARRPTSPPTRVRQLLPETGDRPIHRYELPNLRALNFVLVGYLGEGVASSTAFDAQAKGLGEYLRSRPGRQPSSR